MRKKPPWERKGIRWKLIIALAGVLVVIIAVGGLMSMLGTGAKLRSALRLGRLAAIPKAASDLQCDTVSGGSSPTYFIKFAASAMEIHRFLADSPGLRRVTPETLGPQQMYLLQSAGSGKPEEADGHVYFLPEERFPWFNPTIRVKGRRYLIPQDEHANRGEVIVDDDKHVVYIRIWRG